MRNDAEVRIPDASWWPGLSAQEIAYRESVLRDVRERIRRDGPRKASAHPRRAAQFMPFAALKGYHELARSKEHIPEPRREMTEELALELTRAIGALRKGDVVRVVHYEGDGYVETVGAVSEVVEQFRFLRVVHKAIAFDDIFSITIC